MDDRGKFIYITTDEMNAVAKWIKLRGRVQSVATAKQARPTTDSMPRKQNSNAMQPLHQATLHRRGQLAYHAATTRSGRPARLK
jgi:hypothetical protein